MLTDVRLFQTVQNIFLVPVYARHTMCTSEFLHSYLN